MAKINPFDLARQKINSLGSFVGNAANSAIQRGYRGAQQAKSPVGNQVFNQKVVQPTASFVSNKVIPSVISNSKQFYAGITTPPTEENVMGGKLNNKNQFFQLGSGLAFANPAPLAISAAGKIPQAINTISSLAHSIPRYQSRGQAIESGVGKIPGLRSTPLPGIVSFIEPFITDNPQGAFSSLQKGKSLVNNIVNKSLKIHPDDIKEILDGMKYVKTASADVETYDPSSVIKNLDETLTHYLQKAGYKVKDIKGMNLEEKYQELLPTIKNNIELRSGTYLPKSNIVGESVLNSKLNNTTPTIGQKIAKTQQGLEPLQGAGATGSTRMASQQSLVNSQSLSSILPENQKYLDELTKAKTIAKNQDIPTVKTKLFGLLGEIKTKMVDSASPIEDALSVAEKKYNFSTLPKNDVRLQIDRVLRSKTLASQFAKDNGLVDVIQKAPDLNALDQYMIAKQASRVSKLGMKTGRDLTRDQRLIKDLSGMYEPLAKEVNNYSRNLLDYSVKTGLVDQKVASDLIKKYPEYVPLQRVFSELEQKQGVGTKPIASLSKQSVVKKLVGSERQIESPIESLLTKTQDAFNQGERNIAGKQLASYSKLPGFEDLIKEGKGTHTFSFLDNGIKRTFSTTPEIAAAAKNLNQEQIGFLGKIFQTPTRLIQVGATGLNLPFVVTNMLKDELTGFVNSSQAAKTSLLNPVNFVKSLFAAVGHNDLYDEVVRNAAGGTSFDISRQAPNLSVDKIRSGRNAISKIAYTVKNPGELLKAVEDIIGRSEELGRIKNYAGAKEALLGQGRTIEDATLLASQNARNATANFARKGEFGRVLNYVIPFLNAGIQGSRQLTRSFINNPIGTSAKVGISVFTPIAATTAWNLNDPKRKEVYNDIPQFEKDNNLIIIPDNATKDSQGRWNVIKIPLPPGLSNLGTIERRALEQAYGLDPVKFGEIASNIITTGTSVDVSSGNKLASSLTPQLIKPVVEGVTNKNLFTGQEIVPSYMKNKAPEDQVKSYTSGTARKIGGLLNTSPLMVENTIKTSLGGLGSQILNASDSLLNKAGIIPDTQIGGESVLSNIQRRFSKSSGGSLTDKIYTQSDKLSSVESQAKDLIKNGDINKAKSLLEKNKNILSQRSLIKDVRSRLDDYSSMKNKALKDTRLTKEQRNKLIELINQKITELSFNYNKLIK